MDLRENKKTLAYVKYETYRDFRADAFDRIPQIEQIKKSPVHVTLGNQYTVEMVGSKDEFFGNQICQLDLFKKQLHIRVPYFLEQRDGKYLTFPIGLPKHGQDNLATAWFNKQAITYRFIQKSLYEWEIHITVEVQPAPIQSLPIQ